MSHFDYKRVTWKRVCRICGKPDWCSYTPDERISFCARTTRAADRISRTGWGVFYHDKIFSSDLRLPCPKNTKAQKAELAPDRIRDFAYRKLIEFAPASSCKEITDGAHGLRRRKILDFESYGSLPQTRAKRTALAKKIRCLINQNFPEFVRSSKSSIQGIPGFWVDTKGRARLWKDKDYSSPMLLIPYKNFDGLIEACQIRFMTASPKGTRYVWLSMPEKSGGLTSGSPLHFIRRQFSEKSFLVTEGALKAETIKFFESNLNILASAGVACSHPFIIASARGFPVLLGFDADSTQKPSVARSLARLIALRFCDSRSFGYDFDLKVLDWDASCGAKGLDDAYLENLKIRRISVSDWVNKLKDEAAQEAKIALAGVLTNA